MLHVEYMISNKKKARKLDPCGTLSILKSNTIISETDIKAQKKSSILRNLHCAPDRRWLPMISQQFL